MNEKRIQEYADRLSLPLTGLSKQELFTKAGTKIADGYLRIVIGGRGPYVEFQKNQLCLAAIMVPENQAWRIDPATQGNAYYIEHRSADSANVMIYQQLRPVVYADYKMGLFYISPFDLTVKDGTPLIERKKTAQKAQLSLYD